MKNEIVKSAGMIIFRRRYDEIQFLLLFQSDSQTWSFPKGRVEAGEDELNTAKREVWEEIMQRPQPLDDFKAELTYPISQERVKTVVLFLAESADEKITIQESELSDFMWVRADEAVQMLQHNEYAEILQQAELRIMQEFLKG
ncbi:MAG: NUDIX domain-containing protein [Oscillospiraceae bacterium]|jgi:8-oxo-dGTP pyrophosphatase MutT (NUDIX family)|nr:NUDIX domain-containing protein [Oscillospiraceae bacterium]